MARNSCFRWEDRHPLSGGTADPPRNQAAPDADRPQAQQASPYLNLGRHAGCARHDRKGQAPRCRRLSTGREESVMKLNEIRDNSEHRREPPCV